MKRSEDGALRILLATDGSESAGLAVALVSNIACADSSHITVAHAVETAEGLFDGPWPSLGIIETDEIEEAIRAEAQRTVTEASTRSKQPGVRVETVVLRGRAATAIAIMPGSP